MYPILLVILRQLTKIAKKILKIFGNTSKNSHLNGGFVAGNKYEGMQHLSAHLQKDIGVPPYTSRFSARDDV